MSEHRSSIEIDAAPETVFRFLVTDEGMTTWMGRWASLDPVPGGRFEVDVAGHPVRGRFLEVDPPRRVSVSWGFAGHASLPAGASTVTFELTPISTGTRVEVVHTSLPDTEVDGHAEGWAHFLPRLAQTAEGRLPPPDPWQPGADPTHPRSDRAGR